MKELYKYKDRVLLYDTETKEVKELDKKTARKVLDSRAKVLDSRVRNSIVKDILEIYDDTLIIVTDEKNKVVYKGIVDYAPKEVRDGRWHKGANNKTFTINSERGVLTVKVLDSSVRDSRYDNYYGEEEANKYGAKIIQALRGKTITKRRDKSNQPGGLEYEAKKLGIDMWDFLRALEGLCYQGKAEETSDSTYRIRDSVGVKDGMSESQALENFKRFLKKHYEYTDEDLKKARVEFEKIDYPFKKSKEVWYGLPDGRVASYCSLDGKKWEDL